jgi:hypothetical protein
MSAPPSPRRFRRQSVEEFVQHLNGIKLAPIENFGRTDPASLAQLVEFPGDTPRYIAA